MPNEPPTARPSWRRRLLRLAACGALALFVIGLAVRLTVRDRYLVGNTIYYATPWSVLSALGGMSALWLRSRQSSRLIVVPLAIASMACAVLWGMTSWSLRRVEHAEGTRVLTWNLGHGRWGLGGLAAAAAAMEPDIGVFVEADPSWTDVRSIFRKAFPRHHVFILGGGIVVVSRWPGGKARAYELGTSKAESRIREIDLETPWGPLTVVGCDIASNTLYQREPHFRELALRIAGCSNPVIVAGDFNTPLDSVHLDQLRAAGLREAFETAGSGYLPTWPVPAPVLSLDQIWISREMTPVGCTRQWQWRTDHAAVIAIVHMKE